MKKYYLLYFIMLLHTRGMAQSYMHYTMFMYNKLLYNPAYAGSRDITSFNATYRDQWDGISGAPKTINLTVDGAAGNYMKPFRKVALGVSISNEKIGVESNTSVMSYYAYRIRLRKSTLSFGLQGGANLYSARYDKLSPHQLNDPNLVVNVKSAFLPNFGTGVWWSGSNFYTGLSVPSLLQNYYDKNEKVINGKKAMEVRTYYLAGGYTYTASETIKLQPQVMMRYAGNGSYKLPFNCDINLSAIAYNRILFGATYRTDKSFEAILHVQATKNVNIGYSFDYMLSGLNGYNNGTHELVIGFDLVKDNSKFITPRFIKTF
ncbi:MAG: hypothetical protein JWQ38_1761 [Flavipsychrobacter sp.]|nr:hypothetical protein [Flavipsychrobacter sp.]